MSLAVQLVQFRNVPKKFRHSLPLQFTGSTAIKYSSIHFALAPRRKKRKKNVPITNKSTLITVSVPCRRLLDTEYRPLPRDGVGATQGYCPLPSDRRMAYRSINRSVGNGTKRKKGGHPQQMPTTQILSERKTSTSSSRNPRSRRRMA